MNMKGMVRIWLAGFLMLLAACQQQEGVESLEEAVELTFKLDLKDSQSRADVSPDLVDGNVFRNVSVYLLDANKIIKAKLEGIAVDNLSEETVIFTKDQFKLKRGIYTLMAVANHPSSWVCNTYDDLMAKTIVTSADNIIPKNVVQPLSLMKEIELHAGMNYIEGELVRTFAKFRIDVKNNSSTSLRVKDLQFSSNFTQEQAYVFDNGNDNRTYGFQTAAPIASATGALTPFTKDEGKDYQEIAPFASKTLFESYLLESKIVAPEKQYTYTLDLAYVGVDKVVVNFQKDGGAITKIENLSDNEEGYFLISFKNGKETYYLNLGEDNKVGLSQLNDDELNSIGTHCVWKLEESGYKYRIKNVESGKYLQTLSNGASVSLGDTPVDYSLYDGIRFYNNYNYFYFNNNNSLSGSYYNSTYFTFYKVIKTTTTTTGETVTSKEPIPLTTIHPITQQSSITTAIKRNDYIHVLVTVSYNPVAGTFDFEVKNWETENGDVEFY